MRVLLSEKSFKGHRKTYAEWLTRIPGIDFYILAPENIGVAPDHFFQCKFFGNIKSIKEYVAWIVQMKKIVMQNNIDVLHILDGDSIMRWFGLGFGYIGASKIVVTYHHFFAGLDRRISYRLMCSGEKRLCVVHTASVERGLRSYGLKRIARCEYPAFSFDSISSKDSIICKAKYGIPLGVPTIGIIGGLSKYKNIIPFLEILKEIDSYFHLLICGKDSGVTKEEIKKAIEPYKNKVTMRIKILSDDEYMDAIVASDIIFCIYGYEFDGASGPLTDGVCAEKLILSCKHGSLGEIVSQNLLGITAECDDRKDMLKQTELALSRSKMFKYSEMANQYRDSLNPACFIEKYRTVYYVCCERQLL